MKYAIAKDQYDAAVRILTTTTVPGFCKWTENEVEAFVRDSVSDIKKHGYTSCSTGGLTVLLMDDPDHPTVEILLDPKRALHAIPAFMEYNNDKVKEDDEIEWY
jgi:hypothetical protein